MRSFTSDDGIGTMGLSVIILAGGTGSRMYSKLPKVLHKLAGKPLLEHVLHAVEKLDTDEIFIVHGHLGETVQLAMSHCNVNWVEQKERLGTGHAVQQVLPHLNQNNQILILYGDVPLIGVETLKHLVSSTAKSQVGLLTAVVDYPKGLGRIVRDEYRQVQGIVEERDASDIQRQITEINTGIYCVPGKRLAEWLPKLTNDNAQGEYYLTDVIHFARESGVGINVSKPRSVEEIFGANNRAELAKLESIYQAWQANYLMENGVSLCDPSRIDIRGAVQAGQDCWLDVNVVCEGAVVLGDDCHVGPNCVLKNVRIGSDVTIHSHCVLEDCVIEDHAVIGPFARIRPGSQVQEGAKVGNFVELKNTWLGKRSKASHLSYLGDSDIGEDVNIGAGVITANYDGVNKHQTMIGDQAFIGCNSQLIAPVEVGEGATIAAGTTLTKPAPAHKLTIGRTRQSVIENWHRPTKSKK